MLNKNIILLLGGESSYPEILSKCTKISSNHYQIEINNIQYKVLIAFAQSKSINPFGHHAPTIECISKELIHAEKIFAFGICGSCNEERFSKKSVVFPNKYSILSKQELIKNEQNPMISVTKLSNELIHKLEQKEHLLLFDNQFIQFSNLIENSKSNTRNLTVPGILTKESLNGIDDENSFLTINDTVEMECYQIVTLCKQYNIELGIYLQVSDILTKEDFSFGKEAQKIFSTNFEILMNQIK